MKNSDFERCCILIVLFLMIAAPEAAAQSASEYGAATAKAGTSAAALAPKTTVPAFPQPNSAAPDTIAARSGNGRLAPLLNPNQAAVANRLSIERRAGPDAGSISINSLPEHAQVWIDTMFVGNAPLKLKLSPGQHRFRVSAPGSAPVEQLVDVRSKQMQDVLLQPKSARE